MIDSLTVDFSELLGQSGPFAGAIDGFQPREQQQLLARAVHESIIEGEVLVCEAGTGTGKTLAYLAPAVLSDLRIVISTGTKNLQEQLFNKDLPTVVAALGRTTLKVALLKGRANYLCKYRLQQVATQPSLLDDAVADVQTIQTWAQRTRYGDIAECSELAESAQIWPQVTSTVDNCLGAACEFFESCYVVKARQRAQEAELLVVNHHLFFADLCLREEGFGELLPGADAIIFDEAHQLPDIATRFFGRSLSARQLREFVADTRRAYHEEAGDMASLIDSLAQLEADTGAFRASLGNRAQRVAWFQVCRDDTVLACVEALNDALEDVLVQLELLRVRGKGLESCHRRCATMAALLKTLSGETDDRFVRWVELHRRSFVWHLSPLEIGDIFAQRLRDSAAAWIFTSATLAIGNSLQSFAERLGLESYASAVWDSPFDYAHRSLCYLPPNLPEPREPDYTLRVVDCVLPVLEANQGRAFFLFTSHAALERAAAYLREITGFELFVQGAAPKDQLLRQFRRGSRAVLLGTYSFWEGVDVRGEALSCVVIDKLPFATPDDPVLQARSSLMREQGLEPFAKIQMPQAVIALKQGVGRLIRDESDFGILVLCDPRLQSKSYGKVFMKSLPPMPTTTKLDDVVQFLDRFKQ